MLKKATHIFLVTILFVATSGLAVTRHYCGNSLMSFSLFSTPNPCCEGPCDKCHNERTYNKLTDVFTDPGVKVFDLKTIFQSLNAIHFVEFNDQILTFSTSQAIDLRKFLIPTASNSPAFLGSFRC